MEVFKIPCKAQSAEGARLATLHAHGRPSVSQVTDRVEDILKQIDAKKTRALENPELYGEKISEYDAIESRIYELCDSDEPAAMILIEAMRLNGDSRLADNDRVCAVWVDSDRWIVFGGA
jgi:hypothetical protein